jgi:hypothetical protein
MGEKGASRPVTSSGSGDSMGVLILLGGAVHPTQSTVLGEFGDGDTRSIIVDSTTSASPVDRHVYFGGACIQAIFQ